MKKFILLLISFFMMCFFSTYLFIILLINDFGINVEYNKLLPTVTITKIDSKKKNEINFSSELYLDNPKYIIKNNTDGPIELIIESQLYEDKKGVIDSQITSYKGMNLQLVDNTINVNALPKGYNSYLVNGIIYNRTNYLTVISDEDLDDNQIEYTEDEYGDMQAEEKVFKGDNVTIDKGESYEIKLPS